MRWTTFLFLVLGSQLLAGFCVAMASSPSPVRLSSKSIFQGDLCLIRIRAEGGNSPVVLWRGKELSLVANSQKTEWYGYLVADLTAKPGHYKVLVRMPHSGSERQVELEIRGKNYGVRRLTLPKNMVDLDPKTLKRVKKESKRMKGLWEATPTPPLWKGPFIRPVPGKVVGAFGRRSIINDQPRSPHSGVDLKGKRGEPIMAINRGQVVLTGDHFFTGLTVVIDHGGGILSMYFHLDRIAVQEGERINKGHIIGLVGSTGRATGPHLHWGIRINGDRIDPLRLVALSQQLEE
ncbi:MAG: M23 family metallopeptidase [Desulfobacteraceae bacterium]